MKILIQDIETLKYLGANDTWTTNINAAKDFRFSPRAFETLSLERNRSLRVIYFFEDLDYSIGARNWREQGWAAVCEAA